MRVHEETGIDSLYRSVIMEHYRSPSNRGSMEGADLVAEGKNPLCGDEIRLELKVHDSRVMEARFTGEGCAISLAAASMFTEMLEDRTLAEAARLIEDFIRYLKGERNELDEETLEDLTALEGVSRFPARIKCALLPFTTLKEALRSS
jgi:nitrogen fixation NifU-like protein